MRRQYHFRVSDQGLLAWDVHRLIEQTAGIEPKAVALSDIRELNETYWFGPQDPPPTCRNVIEHLHLVEATNLAYPIILSSDGRVMDGMHRVAKAWLQGHAHIMAVQFDTTPPPDHVGIAPDDLDYTDRD